MRRSAVPRKSGRQIAVVWIRGVHVTAKMSDLTLKISMIPVLAEPILHRLALAAQTEYARVATTMHHTERMNCCEMSKSTRYTSNPRTFFKVKQKYQSQTFLPSFIQ